MKPEHTPLPWEHNGLEPGRNEWQYAKAIWAGKDKFVCTSEGAPGKYKNLSDAEQDANLRLIVHRVNTYDALVHALTMVAADMEVKYDGAEDAESRWMGEHLSRISGVLALARKTILL
jgi:hypothetical protein